jgi:hypothetical protein
VTSGAGAATVWIASIRLLKLLRNGGLQSLEWSRMRQAVEMRFSPAKTSRLSPIYLLRNARSVQ